MNNIIAPVDIRNYLITQFNRFNPLLPKQRDGINRIAFFPHPGSFINVLLAAVDESHCKLYRNRDISNLFNQDGSVHGDFFDGQIGIAEFKKPWLPVPAQIFTGNFTERVVEIIRHGMFVMPSVHKLEQGSLVQSLAEHILQEVIRRSGPVVIADVVAETASGLSYFSVPASSS
jgi:hypothetical protein